MQHFILATLPVMWLLKQTCADSSLYVKMFMRPENKHDHFYVEEGGSKDIECYVEGVESLTINLTWSGPSINGSLPQKTSINYPEVGRQRVGNWLRITQFSDANVGNYICRAITSYRQDLTRNITIAKNCDIGKFGPPSCTMSCSEHCKTGPDGAKGRNCDHINGTCLYGCLEGYTGSMCTDCEIGKFGPPSCTKNCSQHCKTGPDGAKGRNCDHINGTCLNGCLEGYTGSMCTDCEIGKFGPPSCTDSCSEHCKPGPNGAKGRNCDHINGSCLYGCLEGYTGSMCTDCEIGKFGPPSCTKNCSQHCKTGSDGAKGRNCDHINGSCLNGCLEGYTGSMCTDCEIGKFDPSSCTKNCSKHCETGPDGAKGRNCDHINGTCLNGCLEGYTGSMCTVTVKPKEPGGLSIADIRGIVAGIIAFILVVLAVIAYRKRKQIQRKFNIGKKAELKDGNGSQNSRELETFFLEPSNNDGVDTGQDGNTSQNLREQETSLPRVNSNGEERDVVHTGQGARPKQASKSQPPQQSPTSTQLNIGARDVPNSVPNEQLEAAKAPGAMTSSPHTEEEVQQLRRELKESRKKEDKTTEKLLAEKDKRINEKDEYIKMKNKLDKREKELKDIIKEKDKEIESLTDQVNGLCKRIKDLMRELRDIELPQTDTPIDINIRGTRGLDRENRTASGQPLNVPDDPSSPSDTNNDIHVNDRGNSDDHSELTQNNAYKPDHE